jgi:lambda repressor-like predicted transcriptional regulator
MEQQIRALKAEGSSVREIARELGLSRMKVHRILMASPPVPAVGAVPADPILAEQTREYLERHGVSAAEAAAHLGVPVDSVEGGLLNELEWYRLQALAVSPAARAQARVSVSALAEPMPAHVRDDRIVEFRSEGWSLAAIGAEVGMTKGAVSRALERIYDGRPGQQPRG